MIIHTARHTAALLLVATLALPAAAAPSPRDTNVTTTTAPAGAAAASDKTPDAGPTARQLLERALKLLDEGKVQQAFPLLGEAAGKGNGDAAFYLGRILELGLIDAPATPEQIVELYRKGAENSDLARNRMGLLYLSGEGVIRDYETGAKMVCEAARSGIPNAMFNCAIVLLDGRGVKKDVKKATELLKKAAKAGNIGAKNLLAEAYMTGRGVKKDLKKAFQLTLEAANAGNPEGMFRVGQMYASGIGTRKDLKKAYAYFNLAAARRHARAAKALQVLENKMKPEEVIQAQRISRQWKPSNTGQTTLTARLREF